MVGGIGLLKILFAGLLWEGSIRCNDFLIIGQCFALQQRLTLARELKVILLYQPSQTHTIPRKSPTPLPLNERSVCFALFLASHYVLASLVKGRWLDGKAQALTLLHLLAICPLFLYCILFCRQDEGIVTPPSLAPHQPFPKPHYPTNFS